MLPDAAELIKVIKKTAVEAVESTKPVNACFGEVVSTSPLKINVEQRMVLGELQLILSERVVEKPLNQGDNVILLRQQSGQKYIIIDRIGVVT